MRSRILKSRNSFNHYIEASFIHNGEIAISEDESPHDDGAIDVVILPPEFILELATKLQEKQ